MTWMIVRKEIVSNLLSYKFFIVILLMMFLIATSLFIMHRDFQNRMSDYQIIRPKPGEPIALLASNPLSIFAKGLGETMTRSFEVSTIGIRVRTSQSSGNIIYSFFTSPDFLYVVRVILSLVAVLFGFDQISREREQGTLKLILGNSISRAKVLAGKWIGNFLSLAVPFLLVTLLGTAILLLDPQVHFSADRFVRLGLILGLSLLYLGVFLSLGMLVSALTRRAMTSIIILLFVWVFLVFVVPNLGTLAARQFVSIPSVRALSEKRGQTWTREVLLSERGGNWEEGVRTINRESDQMEQDYRLKFERLVRLSRDISRVSPAASFLDAAGEIAGTGISEESRFKEEVVRYKDAVIAQVLANWNVPKNAKPPFPAFSYKPRELVEIFATGTLFDTAWLIFLNILCFAGTFVAFIRADMR
jgi:ABC-type transport system involved in multi-copper enzyme maturation permease subunit